MAFFGQLSIFNEYFIIDVAQSLDQVNSKQLICTKIVPLYTELSVKLYQN